MPRGFIIHHAVDFGAKDGTKTFCNGFVISDGYQYTLAEYQKLIDWAVERLPQINQDEVELRTVAKSTWCKGCPMIRFPLPVESAHPEFSTYLGDVYEA